MTEPPIEPYTPDPLRGWRIVPSVLTFGVYIMWRNKRNKRNRRIAREAQTRLLPGHPGHFQRHSQDELTPRTET
jgi:hypothetical protein